MSDEEQVQHFTYVDELVEEMYELSEKHAELVEEYSRAMKMIELRDWRREYVQWAQDRVALEGETHGDSVD